MIIAEWGKKLAALHSFLNTFIKRTSSSNPVKFLIITKHMITRRYYVYVRE